MAGNDGKKPQMSGIIQELLHKMSLKEKIALLSGRDSWRTAPVERLGIPSLVMTDGPHGVRSTSDGGRIYGPATSFPTGMSMAASWDTALIEKVGSALGEETRALGCDILLGPCINIVRHPLAGRNFESYSEDPYLAGRIGAAYVTGLQSRDVGASVKHFACNNQEIERGRASSEVDERTLREIYLAAFEAVVKEAGPWTVMCSYNRINGTYASAHAHLLNDILREEWGFEGVVISDWGANHATAESIRAGLDIEMPGPAKYYGKLLKDAVQDWKVDPETVDRSAARVIRMIALSGKLDEKAQLPPGSVNTAGHQQLARQLAEESITLLKNEGGILPLKFKDIKSIAVLGPAAADLAVSGGGSAHLQPPYRISPWEALQARLSGKISLALEEGCEKSSEPPALKPECIKPASGEGNGFQGEYFDNGAWSGEPGLKRIDPRLEFWWFANGPGGDINGRLFTARWKARLEAPAAGAYILKLSHTGKIAVYLNGKLVLENAHAPEDPSFTVEASARIDLDAGEDYEILVEYLKPIYEENAIVRLSISHMADEDGDDRMQRAVELARRSDIALVFAGFYEGYETEGRDRADMELPGRQNQLISAVAKANPRTIVVLNCGAPVAMPWLRDVPGLIYGYYPGQEGGNALADVLLGSVNPSGKLPVTFPKRLEDTPAFINYPGAREVRYGEGIFVGYRYYDQKDVEPLFPFGFGLSYTTFEYSDVKAPAVVKTGEPVRVSVTVKNTGNAEGREVVQLYVHDRQSSLIRPPKELKGFTKVRLKPGESKPVEFVLDQRAFSFYDPHKKSWLVEPGEFEIMFGGSSRDIKAKALINIMG
ncbi:MAG: glycoside hydrolase family 3 C-terminal domain-containing protein [Bacillota bacterium]